MTAGEELEAALQRGWSFDELEVYADHLLSKNDPRGDVIALDLSPRPDQPTWLARRRTALAAWLGNDLATRAGHLVQHGFLHELRDGMYPLELLDSAAGAYLRGYVAWGRARVQASLERLAKKPRPWLSRLTIAHYSNKRVPVEIVNALIAATPRLEEVCIVGRMPFAAFPHPAVRRAVLDTRCFGIELDCERVRIDVPDGAAGPRLAQADLDLLVDLVELAPDCNQLYLHGAQFDEPLPALLVRLAAAGIVELDGPVVRLASPDMDVRIGGGFAVGAPDLAAGRGSIYLERAPDVNVPNLDTHGAFVRACLSSFPVSARISDTLVEYLTTWRRAVTARMAIDGERVARLRAAFNALLELQGLFCTDIGSADQWEGLERMEAGLATDGGGWFSRPYDYYWY